MNRSCPSKALKQYLKQPEWRRQHRWRKAIWTTMARMGLTGIHALPMNRRWVEIHRRQMPLDGLDPAMDGMKIVQISDLHYSPVVWQRYLVQYIVWVNELEPDLVVVTGDLITGGYRYAHRVATILSHLQADARRHLHARQSRLQHLRQERHPAEGKRRADYLEKCLVDRGLIVLRNQTHYFTPNGARKPARDRRPRRRMVRPHRPRQGAGTASTRRSRSSASTTTP